MNKLWKLCLSSGIAGLVLTTAAQAGESHAPPVAPHDCQPPAVDRPTGLPKLPGHDTFGAIQEIVTLLAADPETDWSRVDIRRLREHLLDMRRLTLEARANERAVAGGLEILVTGEGASRDAVRRMVPMHGAMMQGHRGWSIATEERDDGVLLTLKSDDPEETVRLRALGFYGFMASGNHHRRHHWAIAAGGGMSGHGH